MTPLATGSENQPGKEEKSDWDGERQKRRIVLLVDAEQSSADLPGKA